MDNRINMESQRSFKLKNINHINPDDFSMNTMGSSAYLSGPHQIEKEISLILGNSFTLENPENMSNIFPVREKNMMLNKKDNLKLSFHSNQNGQIKWQNSTGQNNRIIEESENDDDVMCKQNLDRSHSTTCNLIIEESDDDESQLDNFLRQREGFKKHCQDEIEDESKDPNFLSDDEIDSIIKEKMKILDIYNVVVLKQGKDDINFR